MVSVAWTGSSWGIRSSIFVLYDANIAGNSERYGSIANYVVMNDSWGTERGYVWRIAMEIYRDFPLSHKLFGHGPDTFGIITVQNFWDDMLNTSREIRKCS